MSEESEARVERVAMAIDPPAFEKNDAHDPRHRYDGPESEMPQRRRMARDKARAAIAALGSPAPDERVDQAVNRLAELGWTGGSEDAADELRACLRDVLGLMTPAPAGKEGRAEALEKALVPIINALGINLSCPVCHEGYIDGDPNQECEICEDGVLVWVDDDEDAAVDQRFVRPAPTGGEGRERLARWIGRRDYEESRNIGSDNPDGPPWNELGEETQADWIDHAWVKMRTVMDDSSPVGVGDQVTVDREDLEEMLADHPTTRWFGARSRLRAALGTGQGDGQ